MEVTVGIILILLKQFLYVVSVCSNTMCLSQLSPSEGTGSEKNPFAQLVS